MKRIESSWSGDVRAGSVVDSKRAGSVVDSKRAGSMGISLRGIIVLCAWYTKGFHGVASQNERIC